MFLKFVSCKEVAKILIANTPMDTDKVKIYGSRVRVSSMNDVAEIEAAEKRLLIISWLGVLSALAVIVYAALELT